MQFDFGVVFAFAVAAVAFAAGTLVLGSLLRPKLPTNEKGMIYECGEKPIGRAWFNFNPRFYIVALVFVIFEVEIALTIPVALVFRRWVYAGKGGLAAAELVAFIAILAAGLIWIWARRDLEWVKRLDLTDRAEAPASELRKAA